MAMKPQIVLQDDNLTKKVGNNAVSCPTSDDAKNETSWSHTAS
jgi:hypothetical protein